MNSDRGDGKLRVLVAGDQAAVLGRGLRGDSEAPDVELVFAGSVSEARERLRREDVAGVVVASESERGVLDVVERLLRGPSDTQELRQVSSAAAPSPVTAQMLGERSLRASDGARFRELCDSYGRTLDEALAADARGRLREVTPDLRSLAEALGASRATPRDLIELHLAVLHGRVTRWPRRARGYREIGRVVVLELMGHLASFYRRHAPSGVAWPEGQE